MWIVNKKTDMVYNTEHIVNVVVNEKFAEVVARIDPSTGDVRSLATLGSYKDGKTAKKAFMSLLGALDSSKDSLSNVFFMPKDEEV